MISILTHLCQYPDQNPPSITLLYSTKKGRSSALSSILFFDRLSEIFFRENCSSNLSFELFLTDSSIPGLQSPEGADKPVVEAQFGESTSRKDVSSTVHPRKVRYKRFTQEDLINALGPALDRSGTLVYVCGPPPMTDWAVQTMREAEGMDPDRVLCEKWW